MKKYAQVGCLEVAARTLEGKQLIIIGEIDKWTGMYGECVQIINAKTKKVLYERDYGTIPYEPETYMEDYEVFLKTGVPVNH